MRGQKSKAIYNFVKEQLAKRKLPWRNGYYRTTKKLYNATPRNERNKFLDNLAK